MALPSRSLHPSTLIGVALAMLLNEPAWVEQRMTEPSKAQNQSLNGPVQAVTDFTR
jgi:hypothetical protein